MKISTRLLALLLSVLALSGCATGKCNKNTGCTNCANSYVPPPVETVAATPQAVAAPVAPVAPQKMTDEQIMAAVSK